jgi:two-component system, cell cycle sensor histidine kinase and response regulator CckA
MSPQGEPARPEGSAGGVGEVLGISRDIADRMRVQESSRLRSLALDAADNAIVICDRRGDVVWVNLAFSRLTGYSSAEMLGKNLRLLKSGQHDDSYYQAMWESIAGGKVWHGEVINRHKDGTFFTQDQTITPVPNERGEITHFIAIQQDITSRKRTESELRESRERFERIFNASPTAIAIVTAHEARFLYVNDGFMVPLGYTRDEVVGHTAVELDLYEDPADRQTLRDSLEKQGRVRNYETRFRGKNGRVFDVLLSAEPFANEPEPTLLCMVNDITRWKEQQTQMEEKLRRAQKLESVGTLAGGIAHDFNNILTVIQGHACLLLSEPGLPRDYEDSLRQINLAAERAANLTRQLLTFSRRQPLQRRVIDLNAVVGNMTKMLGRLIREDITLDIQPWPRLPPVMGDVGMIEQVIMNLAINARDAIHSRDAGAEPGRVLISTGAVLAHPPFEPGRSPQHLRHFVCVTVQDNGCGIPEGIRSRVYDPFFTTKAVGRGTGLGLATVHAIVQNHGGWVDLESQVGRGTTFRVYFPSSETPLAEGMERLAPAAPPGGNETILLVEDETALRDLATEVLSRYGYRIFAAESGAQALQLWEEHGSSIDMVLTDLVMPGRINGRQLAENLRARRPALKVLFTTGYSSELEGWEPADPPEIRCLHKPYPPHELAAAVRTCLDGVTQRLGRD